MIFTLLTRVNLLANMYLPYNVTLRQAISDAFNVVSVNVKNNILGFLIKKKF